MTLLPKLGAYGHAGSDPRREGETALSRRLEQEGWIGAGTLGLTLDGEIRALRFSSPGCPQEMRIVVLSPTGQDAALAASMARPDDRLRYIYNGRDFEQPPLQAAWREKLAGFLASLGVNLLPPSPLFAEALPPGCGRGAAEASGD